VESFLVGPSNRLAVDWIDRWPDWPFTALVLVAPPGCGKTHLASFWRARAKAEPLDLAGAGIEQIAAIAEGGQDVLIDDCDYAISGLQGERALLQLYNLVRAGGGRLLLTARRPPASWRLELPDLTSRLNSAMVVAIDSPDDTLLRSIAFKLFADRQVMVGDEVISFLLNRGERSVTGLSRAVAALDEAALSLQRPITIPLARETLAGFESADEDQSPSFG
jgi:chromosomal replication initiation ATPase DnaA